MNEQSDHPESEKNYSSERLQLLFVDDDPTLRVMYSEFLKKIDLDFDMASSGKDALNKISERVYDIVVMDFDMPGLTGIEATAEIRSLLLEKHPTIFGFTGNADKNRKKSGLDAGMNGVFAKPKQTKFLMRLIKEKVRSKNLI
ncbi:MAG: response regulator [Candidatus Gracilibacteria bacterium]|nr:response regulator [Candidatus Gracilibacteria bacterium]